VRKIDLFHRQPGIRPAGHGVRGSACGGIGQGVQDRQKHRFGFQLAAANECLSF